MFGIAAGEIHRIAFEQRQVKIAAAIGTAASPALAGSPAPPPGSTGTSKKSRKQLLTGGILPHIWLFTDGDTGFGPPRLRFTNRNIRYPGNGKVKRSAL